ncbi:hypothetical protein MHT86_01975 [Corynebacterium mastitidis]|uniref:Uncharacterized protein n=1 Tax=Corynebacterium mastitidis TaxID=161890 RepID=A0A2N0X7W9_9CORY|nr:hypothetical protein [Corynebacterium mastitidis]MCH6196267.1 hypothetical protein [Corynebacterium mastitidis]PKF68793.1 hypothetical protein CXB45_05425 [Corynebacterium mastitidis]
MIGTLLSSALSGLLALNPFLSPTDHIPDIAPGTSSEAAAQEQEVVDPGYFIHSGKLAVNRAVFQEEQAAGHDLVTIDFTGDHSAKIQQAATFDAEKDSAALDRIVEVLKINGYDQVSMTPAPLVAE